MNSRIVMNIFYSDVPEQHQNPLLRQLKTKSDEKIKNINPPKKKQNFFLTKNLRASQNEKITGLKTPSNKLKTKNVSNLEPPHEEDPNLQDNLEEDAEDVYGEHGQDFKDETDEKKLEKFVVVPFNPQDPLGKKNSTLFISKLKIYLMNK